MSVIARLESLRVGTRSEEDRRWLIGPAGALAVARSLVGERRGAEALGDLEPLWKWLDDTSFVRAPMPSERARALLALADLDRCPPSELRNLIDVVARGYPFDVARLALRPTNGESNVDLVVREAGATANPEIEQLVRIIHGRIRSTRRRTVSVNVPVSSHHSGELMVLHATRVAGPPSVAVDRSIAPFLEADREFENALDEAASATRAGFAIRWHVEYERSRRPVEWITGSSCGLAAAAAFRSLAIGARIPPDLVFSGALGPDGTAATLVDEAGRHNYAAKIDASFGRRLVVPMVDAPTVGSIAAGRTRGPIVLGIESIDDLESLFETESRRSDRVLLPSPSSESATYDQTGRVVGRGHELRALADHVRSRTGSRLALITGRPGIGKSALLEAFVDSIRDDVRDPIERLDGHDLSVGESIAAMMAIDRSSSSSRPRLVVVDDAHLAADAVLRRLTDRVFSDTGAIDEVVVVLAGRPDAGSPAFRDLTKLVSIGHPSVIEVSLQPIGTAAVELMVASELDRRGVRPDSDLVERIAEVAIGDPLVARLLIDLAAREPDALAGGRVVDRGSDLAAQLVARAMRVVTHPEVLEVAAVVDRPLDATDLANLARLEAHAVRDSIDAASASGLLRSSGSPPRYDCCHAVVRDAIYAGLSVGRRNQLHRRAARHFADAADARERNAILAFHYGSVEPPEIDGSALEYALAAGLDAESIRDFDSAFAWFERAVNLASRVGELGELVDAQVGLGRNLRRRGDAAARRVLLTSARRAADIGAAHSLVSAVLAAHRGFFSATARVDNEWIELLERSLRVVGDDDAARSELLAVLAAELTWQPDPGRRMELADEALDLARRCGHLPTLARVRYRRPIAIAAAVTVEDRDANSRELLVLADRLDDDEVRFMAAITRATVAAEIGLMAEATLRVHDAEVLADDLRDRVPIFSARLARAGSLIVQGSLDAATLVSDEAFALGVAADASDAAMLHGEQLWEIARLQGAHERYAAMAVMIAESGDPSLAVLGARYAHDAGAIDVARTAYDQFVGNGANILSGVSETAIERDLAVLARRFGDANVAERLSERLRDRSDYFANTTVVRACGRHAMGLAAAAMGKLDVAEHWFEAAVQRHETARAPLLVSESLIEWADALVDLSEPEAPDAGANHRRANGLIDRAQTLAAASGATGLTRRCERVRARLALR
jgi:AAA ATPase domain